MSKPKIDEAQARLTRRVFGIVLTLLLLLVPFSAFLIQNIASQDQVIQVVRGEVDAAGKSNLGRVARYIHGEVEFYYNDWLYTSEEGASEEPAQPIYLPTPGYWTGKGEGMLSSTGYGSYRYRIHGLTPGTEINVYPIIDIPNRVYLNGMLCSEIGHPSRSPQSSFVDLTHKVAHSYFVPESGQVEYVMEVGNTGNGGSKRIGIIVVESTFIDDLSTLPFASIAAGSIGAVLFFLGLAFWFSLRRGTTMALSTFATGGLLFFLFSLDSPFVGAGLFYGGRVFSALSIVSYAVMILSVLLYERITRKKVLFFGERIGAIFIILLSSIASIVTQGSDVSVYFYGVLASVPIYLFIRHLIHFIKNKEGTKTSALYAGLGSIGLVMTFMGTNFTFVASSGYPSALAMLVCLLALASGFSEVYSDSLRQKDQATLLRRYHQISGRALSRALNASEAVSTLDYIGDGYEKSLKVGDKRLLSFSTLTRRRLLALREDEISLEEECELEGQLFDLRQAVNGTKGTLILDVDTSEKRIPPLLFETMIDSLSRQLQDGEIIVLGESKRGVSLSFPERLEIAPEILSALDERIRLVGLLVRKRKGKIEVYREDAR